MSLKIVTFGCKVNQYESELLRQSLSSCHSEGENAAPQLIIVNTCTVTGHSDSKCRKIIRKLTSDYPHAEMMITGCYAARAPEELAELAPQATIISDKRKLENWLSSRGVNPLRGLISLPQRHRVQIKIQDGCPMSCAYCIVPRVRSHCSSRAIDDILDEVSTLASLGCREIVFTGIHLGLYEFGLVELLRALLASPSPDVACVQFRLSSIEANEVREEILQLMRDFPTRLVPHLHVPMQSGSSSVLARMRRETSREEFAKQIKTIRDFLPDCAITTDVLVGFPAESDAEFAETLQAINEFRFAKVHVFRYSRRAGTAAATMPQQIHEQIKTARSEQVEKLAQRLRTEIAAEQIGKTERVLIESVNAQIARGTSSRYFETILENTFENIFENILLAEKNCKKMTVGEIVEARITHSQDDTLFAKKL